MLGRLSVDSFPISNGVSDARDSSASTSRRPIAESGFEIVSPVFCKSRLASSLKVWTGTGNASGCADSSPMCVDGSGSECDEALADWGVPGWGLGTAELGRLCIASSTFLRQYVLVVVDMVS